jgi:hypothetical protein
LPGPAFASGLLWEASTGGAGTFRMAAFEACQLAGLLGRANCQDCLSSPSAEW